MDRYRAPSLSPASYTCTTLGCSSEAASWHSRSKRARNTASFAVRSVSTFSARTTWSLTCLAAYTTPIPPRPASWRISWPANTRPGARIPSPGSSSAPGGLVGVSATPSRSLGSAPANIRRIEEGLPTTGQSPRELKRQLQLERERSPFLIHRDADGQQHLTVIPERGRL